MTIAFSPPRHSGTNVSAPPFTAPHQRTALLNARLRRPSCSACLQFLGLSDYEQLYNAACCLVLYDLGNRQGPPLRLFFSRTRNKCEPWEILPILPQRAVTALSVFKGGGVLRAGADLFASWTFRACSIQERKRSQLSKQKWKRLKRKLKQVMLHSSPFSLHIFPSFCSRTVSS